MELQEIEKGDSKVDYKKRLTFTLHFNNQFDQWLLNERNKISSIACSVLRYLISKARNIDGIAFPTINRIVRCTRLSRKSVFVSLKELEALGLIKRGKKKTRFGITTNLYAILLDLKTEEFNKKNDESENFDDEDISF